MNVQKISIARADWLVEEMILKAQQVWNVERNISGRIPMEVLITLRSSNKSHCMRVENTSQEAIIAFENIAEMSALKEVNFLLFQESVKIKTLYDAPGLKNINTALNKTTEQPQKTEKNYLNSIL